MMAKSAVFAWEKEVANDGEGKVVEITGKKAFETEGMLLFYT